MTDLFDLAKPVRDASMAEIERAMTADIPPMLAEGHRLGAHLVALSIADACVRLGILHDVAVPHNLHDLYAVAIGQLIGYVASSFRPIVDGGKPVPPTISGQMLMAKIGACALHQLNSVERGTLDFNLQFARAENGAIEVAPFDFADMLKGKK